MEEIFRNLTGPQFVGLTAIVLGTAATLTIVLVGIYTAHGARMKEVEADTQLKRDLVAAGFTADEIERVVRAKSSFGDRVEAASFRRSAGRCG